MAVYESQTQLLECLRDIWPAQKGLAALLFQDDLFRRLRRLEIITEGGDVEDAIGFLPDDFPKWSGATEEYEGLWVHLESDAAFNLDEPLDVLEDAVCGWVEDMIPENCAFFEAALDTGYLDEKWLHAAQMLLALDEKETATLQQEPVIASVTIEPIATIVLSPEPRPRLPTRRLRRAGRPLTPSRRRKAHHTRRNKVVLK